MVLTATLDLVMKLCPLLQSYPLKTLDGIKLCPYSLLFLLPFFKLAASLVFTTKEVKWAFFLVYFLVYYLWL